MNTFETSNFKHIFVYDLEFIGDINDITSCKIWDISILYVKTGETFGAVIDPDPYVMHFPPPIVDGLFNLTRNFLNENNSKPFDKIWHKIYKWVNNRVYGEKCVFISHNNFSSDKLVLENHFSYYNLSTPGNWYFFDSLNFFRDNIRNIYDYSLKGLIKYLLKKEHTHAHRAEADTLMLYECLKLYTKNIWNLSGCVYPLFITSLRVMKGIGSAVEICFFKNGISSQEFLMQQLTMVTRIGNANNKPYNITIYQYIFDILRKDNIPLDNIKTVANSACSRYVRANFFNNIFNR